VRDAASELATSPSSGLAELLFELLSVGDVREWMTKPATPLTETCRGNRFHERQVPALWRSGITRLRRPVWREGKVDGVLYPSCLACTDSRMFTPSRHGLES